MLSLSEAIIQEDVRAVRDCLRLGVPINQIDEYGFTPLIEAAIADNVSIAQLLIEAGADVRLQDMTGSTALHWAVENNNEAFAELLLRSGADPNAYTLGGQPVLVMPLLRRQKTLKNLLLQYGAHLSFAQDYVNSKLLGHLFELVGMTTLLDTHHQFLEVDFEGFYLEVTLGLITDSLAQYKNHFSARKMRHLSPLMNKMVEVLDRAARLIKYQQYRVDLVRNKQSIQALMQHDPVIIPVGYEGHAITFIKLGSIFVKCDRRETSRFYDHVMIFRMKNPEKCTLEFMEKLIFEKQSEEFISHTLPLFLGLEPITDLKVSAQISGNCSWANVEACVPVLLFLLLSSNEDFVERIPYYKSVALNFFHQWREWNKDRALNFCIQSFHEVNPIRKACKAEILAAILFQRLSAEAVSERARIESILSVLMLPEYSYLLKNYVRSYYYEGASEEGKQFFQLLERYEFKI